MWGVYGDMCLGDLPALLWFPMGRSIEYLLHARCYSLVLSHRDQSYHYQNVEQSRIRIFLECSPMIPQKGRGRNPRHRANPN